MIWIIESPVASSRRWPPRGAARTPVRARPQLVRALTLQPPGRDARKRLRRATAPSARRRASQRAGPPGGSTHRQSARSPRRQASATRTRTRAPARTRRGAIVRRRRAQEGVRTWADALSPSAVRATNVRAPAVTALVTGTPAGASSLSRM
jgi:hypothetical protein